MRVVLEEKLLVLDRARAVGARVAPPIEKITALAAFAALVRGSLGRSCAVVNDPEFVKFRAVENDLIEIGIVVHGVAVEPIYRRRRGLGALRRSIADVAQVFGVFVILGDDRCQRAIAELTSINSGCALGSPKFALLESWS